MTTTKQIDGLRYSKHDHFVTVWNTSTFSFITRYEMTPLMITRYCYNNPGGIAINKLSVHQFNIYHN